MQKKRRSSSRNRTEGHRWERLIVQMLCNSGLYPHAVTCRSANRARDAQGIDICNKDEAIHGRMQDDIQAKTTVDTPSFAELLANIRENDPSGERTPVVFWRKTGKSAQGKFMVKGNFAITYIEDYLKLMKARQDLSKAKSMLRKGHTAEEVLAALDEFEIQCEQH